MGKEGESREWLYEENLIKSIDPLLRKTQNFIHTIKLIINPQKFIYSRLRTFPPKSRSNLSVKNKALKLNEQESIINESCTVNCKLMSHENKLPL